MFNARQVSWIHDRCRIITEARVEAFSALGATRPNQIKRICGNVTQAISDFIQSRSSWMTGQTITPCSFRERTSSDCYVYCISVSSPNYKSRPRIAAHMGFRSPGPIEFAAIDAIFARSFACALCCRCRPHWPWHFSRPGRRAPRTTWTAIFRRKRFGRDSRPRAGNLAGS
jgi:hypothetical protein